MICSGKYCFTRTKPLLLPVTDDLTKLFMRINILFLCLAGLAVQVFADEQLSLLKVGSQTYSNVTVMKICE